MSTRPVQQRQDEEGGRPNSQDATPEIGRPPRTEFFPQVLSDNSEAEFSITFDPIVEYAKIVFDFDKDILYVLGGNYVEDENTFEYRATRNAAPESQRFRIGIKRIDGNSNQPIRIRFLDEQGRPLANALQYSLRLRKKFRLDLLEGTAGSVAKTGVFIWETPLYLKVLGLIATVLLSYGAYRWGWFSPKTEYYVSSRFYDLGFYRLLRAPLVFDNVWEDSQFELRQKLQKTSQPVIKEREKSSYWEFKLADGETLSPHLPDHYSLFDFEAKFKIIKVAGQHEATWILRSDSDRYYEFRYTFPDMNGGYGTLETAIHSANSSGSSLFTDPKSWDPKQLFQCIFPGDELQFSVAAEGNRFRIGVKLFQELTQSATCEGQKGKVDPQRNADDLLLILFDQQNRIAYGNIAFTGAQQVQLWDLKGKPPALPAAAPGKGKE